jgi:hypothetical protein
LSSSPFGIFLIPGTFHLRQFVTILAVLANLEYLANKFQFFLYLPDRGRRHLLPSTRTVVPALTVFEFQGISDYLEDLVAQIDAPLLDYVCIAFIHQSIFSIPELAKFMRRTTTFQTLNEAHVDFSCYGVVVGSLPLTQIVEEASGLRISCPEVD